MAIWYPRSGVTWQQYLQTSAFVGDLEAAMASQSDSIIDSLSATSDQLTGTLEDVASAFALSAESIRDAVDAGSTSIVRSIDQLSARFEYAMSLSLDALEIQSGHLRRISNTLDSISDAVNNPLQAQFRELFHRGCERIAKGLLAKAAEALAEASRKNDTDFLTEFYLGKLYLYGKNEYDDVVDLQKAKAHLLSACRFGKTDVRTLPALNPLLAECLFHTSVAAFAEADSLSGSAFSLAIDESIRLATEAISTRPGLAAAWYHLARANAAILSTDGTLSALERAIAIDRAYAARCRADSAFLHLRSETEELFRRIHADDLRQVVASRQAATSALLASRAFTQWGTNDFRQSHVLAEKLFQEADSQCDRASLISAPTLIHRFQEAASNAQQSLRLRCRFFRLLDNLWCQRCGAASTLIGGQGVVVGHALQINGECGRCGASLTVQINSHHSRPDA